MKKLSTIIWGLVLVAAGVLFGLNAVGVTSINLFFKGWWTLLIIIPCLIGLITEREKTGNFIGVAIGTVLLLGCQGIVSFNTIRKLVLPALIVIVGISLIISGIRGNKANKIICENKKDGKNPKVGCGAFSGCNMNFAGEVFDGADLTAAFGGVKCDLRGAIIEKDCAIKATAVFGGIDITVPDNVNVKVNSTSLFGGVSNKTVAHPDAPTIYVNATCMFGGVDIK